MSLLHHAGRKRTATGTAKAARGTGAPPLAGGGATNAHAQAQAQAQGRTSGSPNTDIVCKIRSEFDSFLNEGQPQKRARSILDDGDAVETRRRHRDLQAEHAGLKARLAQSELECSQTKHTLERECVERAQETSGHQLELERAQTQITDLERQRRFLFEREETARKELTELQDELQRAREQHRQRVRSLEVAKQQAELQLSDLRERELGLHSEQQQSVAAQADTRSQLHAALEEIEVLRLSKQQGASKLAQLETLQAAAARLERSNRELKRQLTQAESSAAQGGLSFTADMSAADARKMRQLQRDNTYLSEMAENIHLLKDQIQSKDQQIERLKHLNASYTRLELENTDLRAKVAAMGDDSSGPKLAGFSSVADLTRELARLQQANAVRAQQLAERDIQAKSKDSHVGSLRTELKALELCNKQLTKQVKESADDQKRMERRLVFVTKERDGMRSIVESFYDNVDNPDEARAKHAKHLESCVAELREQLAAAEQAVKGLQAGGEGGMDVKADGLKAEAGEGGAGQQQQPAPPALKIVHMKHNPITAAFQARHDELEQLRKEVTSLKAVVREYEGAHKKTAGAGPGASGVVIDKEAAIQADSLKQQLAASETRYNRLKGVFAKTVQDFREACYELTGYRIDVLGGSQYRLHSMYADKPDDHLLFQTSASGIQFLETEFSQSVGGLVTDYLQKCHSIPAFLSGVTLDLFSQQTMR